MIHKILVNGIIADDGSETLTVHVEGESADEVATAYNNTIAHILVQRKKQEDS